MVSLAEKYEEHLGYGGNPFDHQFTAAKLAKKLPEVAPAKGKVYHMPKTYEDEHPFDESTFEQALGSALTDPNAHELKLLPKDVWYFLICAATHMTPHIKGDQDRATRFAREAYVNHILQGKHKPHAIVTVPKSSQPQRPSKPLHMNDWITIVHNAEHAADINADSANLRSLGQSRGVQMDKFLASLKNNPLPNGSFVVFGTTDFFKFAEFVPDEDGNTFHQVSPGTSIAQVGSVEFQAFSEDLRNKIVKDVNSYNFHADTYYLPLADGDYFAFRTKYHNTKSKNTNTLGVDDEKLSPPVAPPQNASSPKRRGPPKFTPLPGLGRSGSGNAGATSEKPNSPLDPSLKGSTSPTKKGNRKKKP